MNTFAGSEPSYEILMFSINDTRDVTARLISVTAAIQNPKYNMNLNKIVLFYKDS